MKTIICGLLTFAAISSSAMAQQSNDQLGGPKPQELFEIVQRVAAIEAGAPAASETEASIQLAGCKSNLATIAAVCDLKSGAKVEGSDALQLFNAVAYALNSVKLELESNSIVVPAADIRCVVEGDVEAKTVCEVTKAK